PFEAARSDAVWLCDVDITGPTVRYRIKQAVKTNGSSMQFTNGQLLSLSGPAVEAGVQYGDEAFIFLSRPAPSRPVSADFVLHLFDGVAEDNITREEIMQLVQKGQNR